VIARKHFETKVKVEGITNPEDLIVIKTEWTQVQGSLVWLVTYLDRTYEEVIHTVKINQDGTAESQGGWGQGYFHHQSLITSADGEVIKIKNPLLWIGIGAVLWTLFVFAFGRHRRGKESVARDQGGR